MALQRTRRFAVTVGARGVFFLFVFGAVAVAGAFAAGYFVGGWNVPPVATQFAKPDLAMIRDPLALLPRATAATTSEPARVASPAPATAAVPELLRSVAPVVETTRAPVLARSLKPQASSVRKRTARTRTAPYSVQVKSVPTRAEATAFATKMRAEGFVPYIVEAVVKGKTWYRVRVGEFETRDEAEVVRRGIRTVAPDAIVTGDP